MRKSRHPGATLGRFRRSMQDSDRARGQKRWVKNTLRKYDMLRRGWSGRGAKGRAAASSPR